MRCSSAEAQSGTALHATVNRASWCSAHVPYKISYTAVAASHLGSNCIDVEQAGYCCLFAV